MITRANYYEKIKGIDFSQLDEDMNAMREQVDKITSNGSDWTAYENEPTVKETFDLYFQALELDINAGKGIESKSREKKKTSQTSRNSRTLKKKNASKPGEKQTTDDKTAALAFKIDLKNHFALLKKKGIKKSDIPTSLVTMWDILKEVSEMENPYLGYTKSTRQKANIDRYIEKVRDFAYNFERSEPTKNSTSTQRKKSVKVRRRVSTPNTKSVETLSDELKFIKRYVNLNKKGKTRNQVRLFINALQKSIRERKIRKTSKYAKEVMQMQSELLTLHKAFKNDTETILVKISDTTLSKFLPLLGRVKEMISVKLIKSYINLQGKIITNKQAHSLHTRIVRAFNSGKVTKRDKYWSELEDILNGLETFIEKNPNQGILKIEPRALNGLAGIVGCGCDNELNGVMPIPDKIDIDTLTQDYLDANRSKQGKGFFMSSTSLQKEKFNHVGLKGKWLDFIGDPEVGSRIAVFGEPKVGKSYKMIEFAGYLASNHGTVLYIAKEEGKSATLKKKLEDTQASHPDMYVSDYIPANLDLYDFIFFDSVTKLKLSPENVMALKWAFPNPMFIEVHQVTKDGKARGLNDFLHDVDSIIRLPERGLAIQEGRFNEYAEMRSDVA